jgi:hypothetical protein
MGPGAELLARGAHRRIMVICAIPEAPENQRKLRDGLRLDLECLCQCR